MIRSLKGLSACLAVGLLMSLSSAAAQATPVFEAGKYPALVTGGSTKIVVGTEAGTVTCPIDYEGGLEAASSTLEVDTFIHYYNCNAWGMNMTVEANGCSHVFSATNKEGADHYKGQFGLTCPTSSGLVLRTSLCAIMINPQEGVDAIDLFDDTGSPNRVTLDFEVSGMTYTVIKDEGFFCPFKGTGVRTDGTITGEPILLMAFNESKTTEEVGLAVSGE